MASAGDSAIRNARLGSSLTHLKKHELRKSLQCGSDHIEEDPDFVVVAASLSHGVRHNFNPSYGAEV